MLTPSDIQARIVELVKAAFPGEDLHEGLCPEGFARPCNLVVLDKVEIDPQVSAYLAELSCTFTLTTFVPVDDYHHSHLAELDLRQMRLASLFMPGYIKAGDRAPKVSGLKLAGGYDYNTVTVTLAYTVDKREYMDIATAPIASELRVAVHIKE